MGVDVAEESIALESSADFGGMRRVLLQGATWSATVHLPEQQPGPPNSWGGFFMLLVPGWSGTRCGPGELLTQWADDLAKRGIVAARIDMPGRGDATGDSRRDGLDEMIAAARDAMGEIPAKLGYVVVNSTYVGVCSGGNVALGAATADEPDGGSMQGPYVAAVSTFAFQPSRNQFMGRRRVLKSLRTYMWKALSLSTWMRLFRGELNWKRIGDTVSGSDKKEVGGRNLKDSARNIEFELLRWKGDVIFIWGGGDEEAPPARAHYEKLRSNGMGETVRFYTLEGANHNFYGREWRRKLFALVGQQ